MHIMVFYNVTNTKLSFIAQLYHTMGSRGGVAVFVDLHSTQHIRLQQIWRKEFPPLLMRIRQNSQNTTIAATSRARWRIAITNNSNRRRQAPMTTLPRRCSQLNKRRRSCMHLSSKHLQLMLSIGKSTIEARTTTSYPWQVQTPMQSPLLPKLCWAGSGGKELIIKTTFYRRTTTESENGGKSGLENGVSLLRNDNSRE